jgi:hypothetical protein
MPGLDRTGPQGQGSRTGRQLGRCTPRDNQPDESPEAENLTGKGKLPGRGLGRNINQ